MRTSVDAATPMVLEQHLLRQSHVLANLARCINCDSKPELALASLRLFSALALSRRFETSPHVRGSRLVGTSVRAFAPACLADPQP